MDPHITEWLNLAVRWVHMITGIAWIGASFYFVWLENHLERNQPREGLSGDLWAIHGGGIYHLEKYKLAPPQMPEKLHWFYWEAYATFLSGFTLLAVVYYLNAPLYLIAPGSEMGTMTAIAISIASLLAGWLIYTSLCDSPLGQKPLLLGVVLFALLVLAAWGLSLIYSGRGAFIHIGAIIGTIMVGNVFRIIMPAQRAMVSAIEAGQTPDPKLPAKGLLRSRHNNYFTLPVLFIMISNHFPSTYSYEYNWAILGALAFLSVLVRHYFNTRHLTQKYLWTLPAAALGMIVLAFVVAPQTAPTSQAQAVSFTQVQPILSERCSVCHSANPTYPGFTAPPLNVIMDTPAQIKTLVPRIQAQAITTTAMPLGNITQMTPQERDLLGQWIAQGARIDH
ncbi:urate hydroxylase PuuD [Amphritea sp. 1_MG-2023]|nr:urate hydroxylase PuuD [Amphritea sp. 1_MG-2023]MDO6564262.1 urate hydroxylase PuuD [Amphritea sp. 1_MG-2023]